MSNQYMIHACNDRMWYVQEYLIPSLVKEGVPRTDIIIWQDVNSIGCLQACMEAFSSVPNDNGYTWHLQDDIVIVKDFFKRTQAAAKKSPVVCAYCYWRNTACPSGVTHPYYMWYSFPCIKIDNKIARGAASWYFKQAKYDIKYRDMVKTNKFDDSLFKEYLKYTYHGEKIILNLKPNLVDHIDYLIGGSIVNAERVEKITAAAYFEEPERVEELKKWLKERN